MACTRQIYLYLDPLLYLVGGLCYHGYKYTAGSVSEGRWLDTRKWPVYVLCVLLEDVARVDSDTVQPQNWTCKMDMLLYE
jgi:hypothetical protein